MTIHSLPYITSACGLTKSQELLWHGGSMTLRNITARIKCLPVDDVLQLPFGLLHI